MLSFISATAWSSPSTGMMPTTGPNLSSVITRMPWSTSMSTCGARYGAPGRSPGNDAGSMIVVLAVEVRVRVESFRRFLAESEAYHAEEAAKRGVLREYTAWAVAVGEIDRWQRAVAAASIAPQTAGLSYAYMAPLLLSSTTSTATPPSSSGGGGGGFGGGSVGGGAGGGGGGSW
jgi:uncharacterized membrane protein YgcG